VEGPSLGYAFIVVAVVAVIGGATLNTSLCFGTGQMTAHDKVFAVVAERGTAEKKRHKRIRMAPHQVERDFHSHTDDVMLRQRIYWI
jgi:hypothetical protein